MKKITIGFAAASIAALLTSTAFAQTAGPRTTTVPVVPGPAECRNLALLDREQDGSFTIPNSRVGWITPPVTITETGGQYPLPNGKYVTERVPTGYTVLAMQATDCLQRVTYKFAAPSGSVRSDRPNVPNW